jgi:cobyrinic acid a,c-diamide synthase
VIGALPTDDNIKLSERHLGLIPTPEKAEELKPILSEITKLIEENLDLDKVVEISKSSGELPRALSEIYPVKAWSHRATIGVAFDEAFNFYYQDNLDILKAYGAKIVFFSPIHAQGIPGAVDGLYIGGGFPEVLPECLEANERMRKSLKKAAEDGLPIYAECGGLMYLSDSITDFNGRSYRMVGLLKGRTVMTKRLTLNYTEAETICDNILSISGQLLKGHEFHYSQMVDVPADATFAYLMKRGVGIDGRHDAWLEYNVLASYMHIHFAYDVKLAQSFIQACRKHRRR